MILSRRTPRAYDRWALIRSRFGISPRGAISLGTFARTVSGCWRKKSEHQRARFRYCRNSATSLQRRAREKELLERVWGQRGVGEPNGMRESGSREKNAAVLCPPNVRASCCASLGRKEGGKGGPSKNVQ